ncbi:MAG: glycosyltransferase family 39 protein [Solirubrobacterales bacterium]
METFSDRGTGELLPAFVTVLLCIYALWFLVSFLQRSRPGMRIVRQVAIGFALRVFVAIAISLTALEATLRGGDESFFLRQADLLTQFSSISSQWLDTLTTELHVFVFAGQLDLFDSPELVLRITQVTIAMAGFIFLATAVYELAGPRAAGIAAWVLAFEPSSIFFNSILHKEPNMSLAGGLVAYGGAMLWKRGQARWLLPMVLGCGIAVATRPYAGWFLIAATAAIALHSGLRRERRGSATGTVLVAATVLFVAIMAPTVLEASTEDELPAQLQTSQDANVSDESSLALERVDFSTRESIVQNLPQRIADVLTRPYPWQLENASQQLGALGALIALIVLALLISQMIQSRGQIMARAGPLLYICAALLIAYSLSAGNAGTAFRYRTHILVIGIAALVVLWTWNTGRARVSADEQAHDEREAGARWIAAEPSRAPAPTQLGSVSGGTEAST